MWVTFVPLLLALALLQTVSVGPVEGQEIAALGFLPGLPPVPVMRAPSQCADLLPTCVERATRGECESRPRDMLVNCPASCNSCLPTDPSECIDRPEGANCFYAALLGDCIGNPSYNLAFCSWSCREHIDVCRTERRLVGETCTSPKTVRGSTSGCGYRGASSDGASSQGADLQRKRRRVERDINDDSDTAAIAVNDNNKGEPVTSYKSAIDVTNNSSSADGAVNRTSLNLKGEQNGTASAGQEAHSTLKLEQRQGLGDFITTALENSGLFNGSPLSSYVIETLSSIFGLLNVGDDYPMYYYYPDWACYPGYTAVGIMSLVAGLFNPAPPCEPETITVRETQTSTVTVRETQTSTVTVQETQIGTVTVSQTLVSRQRASTQTVTVSSSVRSFVTRTFVPPALTVIRPAVTLPPLAPRTVFVTPRTTTPTTTTPQPLRQVVDPFVPFCDSKKVDELRAQLKSLIGRNTGRPLPDKAVSLLEAINFCQFGGPLVPESAKDIFNGRPPANWRGLSTPSISPPPQRGPARRADEGEVLYVRVPSGRLPRAADVRRDNRPQRPASAYGEEASRLRRQGLAAGDPRTDGQTEDKKEFDVTSTKENTEQFRNSPGWSPMVNALKPVFTGKLIDQAKELDDLFSNSVYVLNTSTSGEGIPSSLSQRRNVTYLQPLFSTVQTDFNPHKLPLQVQQVLAATPQSRSPLPAPLPLSKPPPPAPQSLNRPPLSAPLPLSRPPLPAPLPYGRTPLPLVTSGENSPSPVLTSENSSTLTNPNQDTRPTLPELTSSLTDTAPQFDTTPDLEIPVGGTILPAASGIRDRFWCGGALVTDRHVVTAAHCVVGRGGSGERPNVIRLGEEDFSTADESKAVDYRIQDISFHPQYRANGEERYFDIAVITLADSAAQASFDPYCMVESPKTLVGLPGKVSGWGSTPNQLASEVLEDTPVVIRELEQCEQLYLAHPDFLTKYYPKGFTETLLCASGNRPGEDACRGDSGGPLVLLNPLETLVGIVSTGYGCGDENFPGIYTRVDAYLDWIDAQLFGPCSRAAFELNQNSNIVGLN